MKKLFLFFLILLTSCSQTSLTSKKRSWAEKGDRLVIDCFVYDLRGELLQKYPGQYCVYLDDGSLISYDPSRSSVVKYDSSMKEVWLLPRHAHHQMRLLSNGDLLVNSSEFKDFKKLKNVRFDSVLVVGQDGKIKKEFSFYKYLQASNKLASRTAWGASWDRNLSFRNEVTHLAASHETYSTLRLAHEKTIPKGSFVLSLNGDAVVIVDPDMKEVLLYQKITPLTFFHDAQQFSDHELIFFRNSLSPTPLADSEQASVEVYDTEKNYVTKSLCSGLFSLFGGGVQVIDKDTHVISDTDSKFKRIPQVLTDKFEEHERRNGRVTFLNRLTNERQELHFQVSFHKASVMNLKNFLSRNIGI